MKQMITMILLPLLLGMFFQGCGVDHTVYLERETEAPGGGVQEAGTSETEESGRTAADGEASKAKEDTVYYVYVCGAVERPGVYQLEAGSRIFEAVAMAGGLTGEAGADSVNQAEGVADGQMVRTPTREEAAQRVSAGYGNTSGAGEQGSAADVFPEGLPGPESADGRLDLNQASVAELMELPGIGRTKAERIAAYRGEHGGFSSVEEIMQVDGIKNGVYNRIRDYIKVK